MENEKQFAEGFNNGYLLAKHEPELAEMLTKHPNKDNDYFQGIMLGKEEFEKEKTREHLDKPKESHSKDVDKDIDKDKI